MRKLLVASIALLVCVQSASALDQKVIPLSRSGGSKGTISHKMAMPADASTDTTLQGEKDDMMARPNLNKMEEAKETKTSKRSIAASHSGGSASARKIELPVVK